MLSLILTALLGLFCYSGSIDNRLSGISNDSNMIVNSTDSLICEDFRSSPVSKSAYSDTHGYTYIGLSEFGDYTFYRAFISNLNNSLYVGNSNVSVSAFLNGTPAICTGLSLQLGTLSNATFTPIRTYTNLLIYHEYSTATSTRTKFQFYGESGQGATPYIVRGYYEFNDSDYRYCINNIREVIDQTGQPFTETNLCFRFFTQYYLDLFPVLNDNDYQEGYSVGYDDGLAVGYQNGYTTGYNEGSNVDATASTIFTGILDVALIPVNVFLTIFNFEVFGINIAGIISALLTVSVVVIIFRFILGGKKDD